MARRKPGGSGTRQEGDPMDPALRILARAIVEVACGDADMLNYLNTVLEFHRGSGWLGEPARYWSDELTKAR